MTISTINGRAVSKICLGSMTWGQQNTETEAHAQIDYAMERGITMIDAAEMYPVPPREETQGRTKSTSVLGSTRQDCRQLGSRYQGNRPSPEFPYLRGGPRFKKEHIIEACEGSLRRLQTDVIDLYQLHWPDRYSNFSASAATDIAITRRRLSRRRCARFRTSSRRARFARLVCRMSPPGARCAFSNSPRPRDCPVSRVCRTPTVW